VCSVQSASIVGSSKRQCWDTGRWNRITWLHVQPASFELWMLEQKSGSKSHWPTTAHVHYQLHPQHSPNQLTTIPVPAISHQYLTNLHRTTLSTRVYVPERHPLLYMIFRISDNQHIVLWLQHKKAYKHSSHESSESLSENLSSELNVMPAPFNENTVQTPHSSFVIYIPNKFCW